MQATLYYEYTVQPAEDLVAIIHRFYGWAPPTVRYGEIANAVKLLNPHVHNIDSPTPGTILLLCEDPWHVRHAPIQPRQFISSPAATDRGERQRLWAMAWAEHSGWLTAPGGGALGATSVLLNNGNLDLLRQVGEEYAKYRQSGGSITRGQYDYRRKVLIERFTQNMGPMERLLFRGANTSQAVRIARGGGVPHDHHIQRQAGRLRQLSSLASKGGILLAGVGVAASCAQIAGAADQVKKNEIFVDAITSTFVGAALGLFVVSNPIGWGTAIVLAAGSAAAAYGAGKLAGWAYDTQGREVDLVSGLGVDRVCR